MSYYTSTSDRFVTNYTAYDFNEEKEQEIQDFKNEYPDMVLKCKFCGIVSSYHKSKKIKKIKCNNKFNCGKKGGLSAI